MILVDTSVWIDYFCGKITEHTEKTLPLSRQKILDIYEKMELPSVKR